MQLYILPLKKNGEVEAIKDVTFSIKEGEFVSLIGPSGCGKSTIVKMILNQLLEENVRNGNYIHWIEKIYTIKKDDKKEDKSELPLQRSIREGKLINNYLKSGDKVTQGGGTQNFDQLTLKKSTLEFDNLNINYKTFINLI